MPISPSPRRGAEGVRPAAPASGRPAPGPVRPAAARAVRPGRPAPPAASPPPAAPRALWPRIAIIGVLAAAGVAVCVLPASLVRNFVPESVQADDFSGSIWHGSAGRVTFGGRALGALEWTLQPQALLGGHLRAAMHWVKVGFVLDGVLDATRAHLAVSNVVGGGPIADLADLGLGSGWRGTAGVSIAELTADLAHSHAELRSAVGTLTAADVSAPQVAAGANLGSYRISFQDPATRAAGHDAAAADDASATLVDTGGPLEVSATLQLAMSRRSGLLSGTVRERPDAAPALRRQLDTLAQLRARDSQGRLPVDLEFTF